MLASREAFSEEQRSLSFRETATGRPASVAGRMTLPQLACGLVISLGVLCGQPLDTMLVLEMSEGTEHATGLIRPGAFPEDDRAGVIGFLRTAQVLQPLTEDRDRLAAALQRAGFRAGGAIVQGGRVGTASNLTVGLAAALYKACAELGEPGSSERKRAIVVVFGSEDPSLSSHLDALKATLGTANARLYAVVVQRTDPHDSPLSGRNGVSYPPPVLTAQLVSELTAESGGRIFKRNWDLKKLLAEARKP